jgi:hypothetical protein
MIKICKKCGLPFIAKLSSETSHKGRCPISKAKRIAEKKQRKILEKSCVAPKTEPVQYTGEQKLLLVACQKYGITLCQYWDIVKAQDGRCAICGAVTQKRLFIDHDHITGKVRGLLCSSCNNGLGQFKDSTTALKQAIVYLEKK